MIDSTNQPAAKTIIPLCPMMSQRISWEVRDATGKSERRFLLVEQPCVRGGCMLWDVPSQGCGFKGESPTKAIPGNHFDLREGR